MEPCLNIGDITSWEYTNQDYVYDIEVEDTHCYYIMSGQYELLVHNSSKTVSTLQNIFLDALYQKGRDKESVTDEEPYVCTIVAESWPTLERGALRDFKMLMAKSKLATKMLANPALEKGPFKLRNGSIIEFVTVQNTKQARHGKRDVLFLNEVNSLNYEVCDAMMVRTSYRTYMDYNSDSRFWVHERMLDRDDVDFFISNYSNNKYIPAGYKRQIEQYFYDWRKTCTKDRPKGNSALRNKWIIYGLGKTGVPEGAIYDQVNWVPLLPVGMKYKAYFIDWGFVNDPLAVGVAGVYNRKIYAKELIYGIGIRTEDLIKRLKKLGIRRRDLLICDNSDPESIAQLKKAGFRAIPFNDKRNKVSTIKKLQTMDINLTYDSLNWSDEQQNYKWKKIRGEYTNQPIDGFDHLWDGLLYWYKHHFGKKKSTLRQRKMKLHET